MPWKLRIKTLYDIVEIGGYNTEQKARTAAEKIAKDGVWHETWSSYEPTLTEPHLYPPVVLQRIDVLLEP